MGEINIFGMLAEILGGQEWACLHSEDSGLLSRRAQRIYPSTNDPLELWSFLVTVCRTENLCKKLLRWWPEAFKAADHFLLGQSPPCVLSLQNQKVWCPYLCPWSPSWALLLMQPDILMGRDPTQWQFPSFTVLALQMCWLLEMTE